MPFFEKKVKKARKRTVGRRSQNDRTGKVSIAFGCDAAASTILARRCAEAVLLSGMLAYHAAETFSSNSGLIKIAIAKAPSEPGGRKLNPKMV